IFLDKTKTALKSLYQITHQILPGDHDFVQQVHFLNRYSAITKILPPVFLRLFYKLFHRFIESNLTGDKPSLFWFDVYKLGFYSTLKKE
ncbi:MAG TPA: hypothetical protein VK872_08120, partial [Draconibacterium sp.]|nr:hypothetical protein [Draconibacterium sp.]